MKMSDMFPSKYLRAADIPAGREVPFSIESVEMVAIVNQLGRRNLTDEQKSFLRGKRQQAEKKAEGPPQKTDAKVAPLRTAERLAKEYDVSPRTIMNDATFADAVDKIEEVQGPEARAEGLLGKSKLGKAAAFLGVKPQTLAVWATTHRYDLPMVRVGARVRYRRADLDKWLESRTVGGAAE